MGCDMLIKGGADVECKTLAGYTPLTSACYLGNEDVVKYLIGKKAEVNVLTKRGFSSLHLAALRNNENIVKILLNAGADAGKQDKDGRSALKIIQSQAQGKISKETMELLGYLSKLEGKSEKYTPLQLAIRHNKIDVAKHLLQRNIDVNE